MQKQVQYIIKGMNRDMTVSKFPADHSFENKNIRITQTADQTLLSITNEKGPAELEIFWDTSVVYTNSSITSMVSGNCAIAGNILGHCVIRQYLILFVRRDDHTMVGNRHQYTDSIFRIDMTSGGVVVLVQSLSYESMSEEKEIFTSGLNFGDNITALGLYENDNIIKVYFADNRNQNRVINIVDPIRLKYDYIITGYDDQSNPIYGWKYINSFTVNDINFIPLQSFGEDITIERIDSSNGVFAPGALQYAFTYHNVYGQETSIFHQSDLYYTSFVDRGGNEEETVSNAFRITLQDLDTSFDYVRIYAILRTSINAVPQCRIVADLKTQAADVVYVDNGTVGENYDYNALLYMNGEMFSSKTLAAKDLTLFSGNINLLIPRIDKKVKDYFRKAFLNHLNSIPGFNSIIGIVFVASDDKSYSVGTNYGSYPYNIHLEQKQGAITTFKYLETYRFGLQFLHKSGKWSDTVFIGDAENLTPVQSPYGTTASFKLTTAQITMNLDSSEYADTLRWLGDNGFIKIRPVVVYPELWDRSVLAQGIVCPTVFNVEDRNSNRPFAYSSWYARPNSGNNPRTNTLGSHVGYYNEYRHNRALPKSTEINAEIQCIRDTFSAADGPTVSASTLPENKNKWVQDHKENFFIDKSIVTFHSPELELSDDLDVMDLTNVKFRIVGIAPLTGFDSNIYISTSTVGNPSFNTNINTGSDDAIGQAIMGPGFYDEQTKVDNISPDGWRSRMGNINWIDEETHYKEKYAAENHNSPYAPKWFGYFIYPWHRSKSLNNTVSPDENGWESALLENKIHTNSRYSYNSYYFPGNYTWTPDNEVSGIKLANIEPQAEESEVSLIKIPAPENSDLDDLNYYGSVDKIVVTANGGNKAIGYPIVIAASSRSTDANKEWRSSNYGPRAASNHELFTGQYDARSTSDPYYNTVIANHAPGTLMEYVPEGFSETTGPHAPEQDANGNWSSYINSSVRKKYWQVSTFDPVRIRFKSTKHAVMAFNYTSLHEQVILPRFSSDDSGEVISLSGKKYFWEIGKNESVASIKQHIFTSAEAGDANTATFGYLFIGELYRDSIQNRFGGETEEALEKNTWIPAGDAISIPYDTTDPIVLDAYRGDTYYQRYDCLKTYPFTLDEKNSIIETVSFMCETRINCDGRYDKNRGNATKFSITPKNFNLMNPVYNQRNNFFNYQYLNDSRVYPDHFNQITWSMTKSLGEEIDTWAKTNLSSLLDMDGEYGEITSLVFFGNEVWCFQEKGISKILFNTRVQIPVSDGVPIEITNGMKVQGKIYVTTKAGLQDKFAITVTPNGIYFMDGYNHTISIFNGQTIQNLSDIKGFREWMYQQDAITEWKNNPAKWREGSYKVFYDSAHQDVYFVNGEYCLVFSELLAEFVSFFDYDSTAVMDTVHNQFYAATDFVETPNGDPRVRIWRMFEGDYNIFYKPAEIPDEIPPVDPEEEPTYPWMDYYRPFYVIYNVNPDPTMDKTFDNMEFRSDSWDAGNLVTHPDSDGVNKTFDTLDVWNEYQNGRLPLVFKHTQYSAESTLKRKFRIWKTVMPRQEGTRNRIRNTWAKVRLAWETPNKYKTVLHDVIIKYFV